MPVAESESARERAVVNPTPYLREPGCEPRLFDLSDNWKVTFALLDATRDWRERAVHEFVLRDTDHVDVATSYQIRVPLELVLELTREATPLAERLLRRGRSILMALIAVLWFMTVARLLLNAEVPVAESVWRAIRDLFQR